MIAVHVFVQVLFAWASWVRAGGHLTPWTSCLGSPLLKYKESCGLEEHSGVQTFLLRQTDEHAQVSLHGVEDSDDTEDDDDDDDDPEDYEDEDDTDDLDDLGDDQDVLTVAHTCSGQYCVYADPSFDNGRGISLITTTDIAHEIARSLRVANGVPLNNPENLGLGKESRPPYRVQAAAGKGLGLVATQPIRRGQIIMAHTPLVLAHLNVTKLSTDEQNKLLQAAVDKLPPAMQQLFWAQMGALDGGHTAVNVMHTNAFGFDLSVSNNPRHLGNFPEVSRFNHDCRPNVVYYITPHLQHVTHAVRDIAAGEELSISYLDSTRARTVRRDRSARQWGFQCKCSQCGLQPSLGNASDYRLSAIYETEERLSDWSTHNKIDEDDIQLLLSLYEQERLLHSHSGAAYTLAAVNYNALGRDVKARQYAMLALEQVIMEDGPWSETIPILLTLMQEPRKHSSWRQRLG